MMKKDELQTFVKTLIPAIRKIVRNEVYKIAKPLIEEEVENKVNKILAEHFINSMKSQPNLNEAFSVKKDVSEKEQSRERDLRLEQERRKQREILMRKLGADESPMIREFYEGIGDDEISNAGAPSQAMVIDGHQVYQDTDDEGVDIMALMGR